MSEIRTIHDPFMRWLREKGVEFIRARSDKASTISTGWPDFTLIHPSMPCLLLEMKVDKRPLSTVQKIVHRGLTEKGYSIHVIRSITEAVEVTQRWMNGEIMQRKPKETADAGLRQTLGHVFQLTPSGWQSIRKVSSAADLALPPL